MITSIGYTEGQSHYTFVELLYRVIGYAPKPPDPKRGCNFAAAREKRRKGLAQEPGKNLETPPPTGRLKFNCPESKLPWPRLVWTGAKGAKKIRQDAPIGTFRDGGGSGHIALVSGAQVTGPGGGGVGGAPRPGEKLGPHAVERIQVGLPQISLGPASTTMPGIAAPRKKRPGEP